MKIKTLLMCVAAFAVVSSAAAAEKTFASKSRWIWFDAPAVTPGDCYYRTVLDIKDKVESLEIIAYLDDGGHFFFNGKQIAPGWTGRGKSINARKYVLTKYLKPGKNSFAFAVKNIRAAGGMMLLGKIIYASGKAEYFHSDKSWKASPTIKPGWHTANYDDSDWKFAKEFGDVNTAPWAKLSMVQTICRTPEEIAKDTAK